MSSTQGRAELAGASTALAALRATVLVRMLDCLWVGGVLICGLLLSQNAAGYRGDVGILCLMALGVAAQRLFHRRLGFHRSALLLLVQLAVISSYLLMWGRLTPGAALLQLILVLSASLFFGRHAGLWALAFCLAALAVGAVGTLSGYFRLHNADYWDPMRAIVWVRYGVVLAFFGGALALAFASIIAGLESSLASTERALQREREERTERERAQAALAKARRAQALGELAAGIAHDFNNSLTVILATADLMQIAPGVTPELSQLAQDICTAAGTAAGTARQLLALGRDERPKPTRISVAPFLDSLETPIRRLLQENISCTLEIRTSAEVFVDSTSIQQSLFNLAINARDAMPDGGAFEISAVDCDVLEPPPGWPASGGAFVMISCRDTGAGIDTATMERIFEPFFTTKAAGKGTGLGLAMVRKAISDSNGYVLVESARASGTTVRLCLPVAPSA